MVSSVTSTASYASSSVSSSNTAQDALKALLSLLKQASSSASSTASSGSAQPSDPLQALFNQIDTNGDGNITKSDLEAAVTKAGGSKASADALWSKLDPTGADSINEQTFAQNLPKPQGPPPGAHAKNDQNGASGNDDAAKALAELLSQAAAATPMSQTSQTSEAQTGTAGSVNVIA